MLMKRKTLALTVILPLLFSVIVWSQLSLLAKANFVFPPANPSITVESPTNSTYNTTSLSLKIMVNTYKTGYWGAPEEEALRQFTYTLDGKNPEPITITGVFVAQNPGGDVNFYASTSLENLTEGLHTLNVRVVLNYSDLTHNGEEHYKYHTESESTVCFSVDTGPPEVVVYSLENKSYYTTDVPLNFTVSESDIQMTYSLDGRENVTTVGNTTLTNLSSGVHNVTVYAIDVVGNVGFSETITFTVVEEPFPVVPVAAASVASAGIIAVSLLVYFKKRKR